jgi:large subunit ribosomal protein L15e
LRRFLSFELKFVRNLRSVAEERAGRVCNNLRVLNSYWVTEDALHYWYEVILIDPEKPEIQKDPKYKGILTQRGRVFRGLTSAGTKSQNHLH